MTRKRIGRLLILGGLLVALGAAWAAQDPAGPARLGLDLPASRLALLALLLGLAGAILVRIGTEAKAPDTAPPAAAPVEPEASVETIRRRLRETDEKP